MLGSGQSPATDRRRRPSPTVSVVIPVRDPCGLPLTLRALPLVDEVVVVTEGPDYRTAAVLRSACPDAVLVHPTRPGPGSALAHGLAAAHGDVLVTLDADGSADPGEIPRYLAALAGGADVAVGSRYRDGGRDLTAGRFRRWGTRLLVWVVNVLFGTRRTDTGFGYAAFHRDALARLDLPGPGAGAGGWGDGPEIGPLLALRPAARGLTVAEVGSVAYPRMRRTGRARADDEARLRHWVRAITREYAGRSGGPRHVLAGQALVAPFAASRTAATPPRRPGAITAGREPAGRPDPAGHPERVSRPEPMIRPEPAGRPPEPRTPDRDPGGWPRADRRPAVEPIWAPPYRRRSPVPDLWLASWPPGTGPAGQLAERRTTDWGVPGGLGPGITYVRPESLRDATGAIPPARREVGTRRRRLTGYPRRPELRVINGEGDGTDQPRSGRLRPVPPENLGG